MRFATASRCKFLISKVRNSLFFNLSINHNDGFIRFSGVWNWSLSVSDIKQSIIATEFGSNRDSEVVDKIFTSLRNVLSIPVHG